GSGELLQDEATLEAEVDGAFEVGDDGLQVLRRAQAGLHLRRAAQPCVGAAEVCPREAGPGVDRLREVIDGALEAGRVEADRAGLERDLTLRILRGGRVRDPRRRGGRDGS